MDKSVIIHVGMPKTATTFLQVALFPKIQNAFYFERDPDLWKLIFYMPFSHKHFTDLQAYRERIDRVCRERSERTLLISHESLFGHPWFNFENHENDAWTLSQLFPNAKILVTIRRQDQFLESLYSHAIQVGYAQKLDRFLNYENGGFGKFRYNTGLNIDVARLDYLYYTDVYEQLFGRKNVMVLPYEMLVGDRADFLNRFFTFSGCEPCAPEDWNLKVNKSLTHRASRLARFLNPLFRNPESNGFGLLSQARFRRLLYRLDLIIGKKGCWIDEDLCRKIVQMHARTNEALDRRYEIRLQDYGYYQPPA